jgi:hypothetical protein
MASYTSMYIRSQKGIKTKMETTVGLYDKENEIIFQFSFCVGSCLVLNDKCHCMCYHCQNMLHHWTSRISNDNVRPKFESCL